MEAMPRAGQRASLHSLTVAIVLMGSLWGLSEVILNDAIRAAGLPLRAAILTGVGMLIMGMALGLWRNVWMLLGIPVVAVLLKQLVVPILGVSVLCKANSCLAVGLHAVALTGVVGLSRSRLTRRGVGRVAAGGGAALVSAVPFYFVGLRLAPCPYLLSFGRPGGFASFMVVEGLAWAVFAGVLFPLGYWLGQRAGQPVSVLEGRRPRPFYAISAGLVGLLWAVGALWIVGSA